MRRRGWSVAAAMVVALAALVLLLAHSVRREALVRRQLIVDTHRGVADLVTARLAGELADAGRALDTLLRDTPPRSLAGELRRIEAQRPWLAPLVMVPLNTAGDAPAQNVSTAANSTDYDRLMAAAEHLEFRARVHTRAAAAYTQAAAAARDPLHRLRALNGAGRSALNTGRYTDASRAYRSMIESANPLVAAEARWAMIARSQLLDVPATPDDVDRAALDLVQFLLDHRYLLLPDEADFHLRRGQHTWSQREHSAGVQAMWQQLADRQALLSSLDADFRGDKAAENGSGVLRVQDGPSVRVASVIRSASARALFNGALAADGPWASLGVAVTDDQRRTIWSSVVDVPEDAVHATAGVDRLPGWRVAAFPRSGSVAAAVTREANRYTLGLALVFGIVGIAVGLVARSVSRELALARLRAEFVASVSHELKTPLSLIRMFAESLREGWVADERKREYYEVITRESERLSGLIDNVLDFSRVEAGTRQYQFAVADFGEVVESLLARYAFHLEAARVELVVNRPADPVMASVDRGAIEQILVNLLSNAVKYMGDERRSPRRVTISLARAGDRLALSVADTGIGMSVLDRARIFERFYRAGDARVRSVTGSGLGLALVKAHVVAHGGAIAVESVPDHGSTFTIDLPLTAVEATS